MTRRNGIRYTMERKAEAIKRMMTPNNEPVAKISQERRYFGSDVVQWRTEAREAVLYHQAMDKQVTIGAARISI